MKESEKTSDPSVFHQRICHTPFSRLVERSWRVRSHAPDHPFLSSLRDTYTSYINVYSILYT